MDLTDAGRAAHLVETFVLPGIRSPGACHRRRAARTDRSTITAASSPNRHTIDTPTTTDHQGRHDMTTEMSSTEDIIGRAEIDDFEAILSVVGTEEADGRPRRPLGLRLHLHLGLREGRPAQAEQALREGQGRPVERRDRPALGDRGRPGEAGAGAGRGHRRVRRRVRPDRHPGGEVGRQGVGASSASRARTGRCPSSSTASRAPSSARPRSSSRSRGSTPSTTPPPR